MSTVGPVHRNRADTVALVVCGHGSHVVAWRADPADPLALPYAGEPFPHPAALDAGLCALLDEDDPGELRRWGHA